MPIEVCAASFAHHFLGPLKRKRFRPCFSILVSGEVHCENHPLVRSAVPRGGVEVLAILTAPVMQISFYFIDSLVFSYCRGAIYWETQLQIETSSYSLRLHPVFHMNNQIPHFTTSF
jgi:hypothetical protein